MNDELTTDLASIATATPEQLAALRMRYQFAAQRARERLATIDEALLVHIEANGGRPIRVSDTLELRSVRDGEWKGRDNSKGVALRNLFDAVAGDFDAAADYLCSQPYKPGAMRKLLPAKEFDVLFQWCERVRLEGKVAKKLAVVNPQILEGSER